MHASMHKLINLLKKYTQMKLVNIFILSSLICVFSYMTNAQTVVPLGDAQNFAVLASSTVTNTGNTVITGDMGVSPGSAITGFNLPGKQVKGQMYSGALTLAGDAQASAVAAYINAKAQATTTDLTGKMLGQDAGAATLTPGVYNFSSSAGLTGTLTLNDGGDPNAVFIFKMGSTLTTATLSKVVMSSGGNGANVFWICGSSATIGTNTTFVGNIIALASITMITGATTTGRLFALNGAVTMDANTAYSVSPIPKLIDTDGDGVPDASDDYPNDASKAYNNYSAAGGSTNAFEDQWPKIGDYDMNDLTMVSRYNIITNAQNVVVRVTGFFTLVAAGGNNSNGFGIEFPISKNSVTNVTGATLETGQTKAVVILFTDRRTVLLNWNTVPGVAISIPKTDTVTFDVVNGPLLNVFGTDYNPFIFNFVGTSRREVHAVGKTPTSLADFSIFGTGDDASNVTTGTYYVTKTGLPFSIILPTSTFSYPIEGVDITRAYLHFADWARGNGTTYLDWYSNLSSDYRNTSNIYTK